MKKTYMFYVLILTVSLSFGICRGEGSDEIVNEQLAIPVVDGERNPNRNLDARIIGGENVVLNEFPSFGRNTGKLACGGTLIHKDVFLTSAFCEQDFVHGLYLGGILLNGTDSEHKGVSYTYVHPDFDKSKYINDIMVVKLKQASNKPVQKLNVVAEIPKNQELMTVIGYGQTNETETKQYSLYLMKVQVPIIPYRECAQYYGDPYSNGNIQICAGNKKGGTGICFGDGGAPLITSDGFQVGISSYTTGCARPNSYPGYTRVSAYSTFIQEAICSMSEYPPPLCKIKYNKKLKCGRSFQCPGKNWISKIDSSGKCLYKCVSQLAAIFYTSFLGGGWKCGQTCFPKMKLP